MSANIGDPFQQADSKIIFRKTTSTMLLDVSTDSRYKLPRFGYNIRFFIETKCASFDTWMNIAIY
jgi:hypothetical protein